MIDYLMVRYGKTTKPIKYKAKEEFREDYDPILPIFKYFKIIEDAVYLEDDTKLPWQPDQILQKKIGQMEKWVI